MFAEKLRSLLKFGAFSTRYKDIFDLYYLSDKLEPKKLRIALLEFVGLRSFTLKNILRDENRAKKLNRLM